MSLTFINYWTFLAHQFHIDGCLMSESFTDLFTNFEVGPSRESRHMLNMSTVSHISSLFTRVSRSHGTWETLIYCLGFQTVESSLERRPLPIKCHWREDRVINYATRLWCCSEFETTITRNACTRFAVWAKSLFISEQALRNDSDWPYGSAYLLGRKPTFWCRVLCCAQAVSHKVCTAKTPKVYQFRAFFVLEIFCHKK